MSVFKSINKQTVKAGEVLKSKLKKIIDSLQISPDFKPIYLQELNRLARQYFLIPTIAIVLFSWLFFIRLDQQIHPKLPGLEIFKSVNDKNCIGNLLLLLNIKKMAKRY